MIRLIEGVFSKILGLATLKYFKSGRYYISSASPTRTTDFYLNQDFLRAAVRKYHVISPGGVQNEKIENPQTLSEYSLRWTISRKITFSSIRFFFYACRDEPVRKLTRQFSGANDHILLKNRLKIKEETFCFWELIVTKRAQLKQLFWCKIFLFDGKLNIF